MEGYSIRAKGTITPPTTLPCADALRRCHGSADSAVVRRRGRCIDLAQRSEGQPAYGCVSATSASGLC